MSITNDINNALDPVTKPADTKSVETLVKEPATDVTKKPEVKKPVTAETKPVTAAKAVNNDTKVVKEPATKAAAEKEAGPESKMQKFLLNGNIPFYAAPRPECVVGHAIGTVSISATSKKAAFCMCTTVVSGQGVKTGFVKMSDILKDRSKRS